jgi:hypothetical protein
MVIGFWSGRIGWNCKTQANEIDLSYQQQRPLMGPFSLTVDDPLTSDEKGVTSA